MSSAEPSITWAETSAAACSGAVLTSLFTTPLDVLKVRMHQQPMQSLAACSEATCCRGTGTSMPSMILRLARHEGIRSLWSGLQPALIMSVPGTVLYFATYEAARDLSARRWPQLREYAPLMAGGGARLLTATVVSPIELMRTRMQAEQSLLQQGMLGGAVKLVRREGWLALFKGLTPSLWRDVPFSCIYWMGYEALKTRALASSEAQDGGQLLLPSISFCCGAAAGSVAAFVTNPFDVLKTRQQIADHAQTSSSTKGSPSLALVRGDSTLQMLSQIARQEGITALFAGLGPRLLKVAPSCAIMIASFEAGKGFFRRRAAQRSD